MSPSSTELATALHRSLCLEVRIEEIEQGILFVHTPLHFADGDEYQIYLRLLPSGSVRVSDFGHTLMQLSYDIDIEELTLGSKAESLTQILRVNGARMENGEVFIETTNAHLANAVFRMGQTITSMCAI